MKSTLISSRSFEIFSRESILPASNPINTSAITSSAHRFNPLTKNDLTSTFFSGKNPWQLIPNIEDSNPSRGLRLIVHGSAGGKVHHLITELVKTVEHYRGSHVDLEILTKGDHIPSTSSSIWLVPLLLLPGKHVQNDIPIIFRRLCNQGISTRLIPFLGSWPHMISILKLFVDMQSQIDNPILLHHPLNSDIGSNYLKNLKKALNIPILPWTKWNKLINQSNKRYTPIPFSLAPNKNTRELRTDNSISSLLEIDFFKFSLIHYLTCLP